MKQALVEGAVPIPGINMFEQGQGKLHLLHSMVSCNPSCAANAVFYASAHDSMHAVPMACHFWPASTMYI